MLAPKKESLPWSPFGNAFAGSFLQSYLQRLCHDMVAGCGRPVALLSTIGVLVKLSLPSSPSWTSFAAIFQKRCLQLGAQYRGCLFSGECNSQFHLRSTCGGLKVWVGSGRCVWNQGKMLRNIFWCVPLHAEKFLAWSTLRTLCTYFFPGTAVLISHIKEMTPNKKIQIWSMYEQDPCTSTISILNPVRTALPLRGQSSQILSSLFPKRDCGSKLGVENMLCCVLSWHEIVISTHFQHTQCLSWLLLFCT